MQILSNYLQKIPLEHLEDNLVYIAIFTLFWEGVYSFASTCSENNKHYQVMSPVKKADWRMHITSTIHAAVSSVGVIFVLFSKEHYLNPIYGTTRLAEFIFSITLGYFVWDIRICLMNYKMLGAQFLIHGILAFAIVLSLLVQKS
jgi:hypothetical protein